MSQIEAKRSGSQGIDRAVQLLQLFDKNVSDISLSELAGLLELPLSTTHRIVNALVRGGLLAQNTQTEKYHLGGTLLSLGQSASQRLGLHKTIKVLNQLVQETGETATLIIERGGALNAVAWVESPQIVRAHLVTGGKVAQHASAAGKLFLAFESNISESVANLGELQSFTPQTITDPQNLIAQCEAIKERGFAVNNEEMNQGVWALAVPVRYPGESDGIIAALSLEGPVHRLGDSMIDVLLERMVEASQSIAEQTSFDLI